MINKFSFLILHLRSCLDQSFIKTQPWCVQGEYTIWSVDGPVTLSCNTTIWIGFRILYIDTQWAVWREIWTIYRYNLLNPCLHRHNQASTNYSPYTLFSLHTTYTHTQPACPRAHTPKLIIFDLILRPKALKKSSPQ